jgi:hypothetical protein
MALIELNLDPSQRELRIFGAVLFPAFFVLVSTIVWVASGSLPAVVAILGAAFCIAAIGLVYLPFMRMVYITWMYAAYPIGMTVSHVVLASCYYLLLTPIGLLTRLFRRDPLARRLDRSRQSYWTPRKQRVGVDQYFRQF